MLILGINDDQADVAAALVLVPSAFVVGEALHLRVAPEAVVKL